MALGGTLSFVLNHPLNRKRRLGALASLLRWQLASRLLPGDQVHAWVMGTRFRVRKGETGLTGNIYAGLHDFREMAFTFHLLRPGDLFVDMGANVGSYTLLACAAAGADGIAIEPVPGTFERLLANVALNRMEPRVSCRNIGLAKKGGKLRFSADKDTMNRVVDEATFKGKIVEVDVDTVDRVLGAKKPLLIKMDLEGYEWPVLQGASRTLAKPSLRAVICEVNQQSRAYGFDSNRLFALMKRHGFKIYDYDPMTRSLQKLKREEAKSGNVLFLRPGRQVEDRLKSARPLQVHGIEI